MPQKRRACHLMPLLVLAACANVPVPEFLTGEPTAFSSSDRAATGAAPALGAIPARPRPRTDAVTRQQAQQQLEQQRDE